MSVQHTLLHSLKEYARSLFRTAEANSPSGTGAITDDHPDLPMFCATIEKILEKGLKQHRSLFSITASVNPSPWSFFESLGQADDPSIPFSYRSALFYVKDCRKTKSMRGKMRLLIRNCLVTHCLHTPLEQLKKHGPQRLYYPDTSLMADLILMEMFMAIILQVTHLTFNLSLENCSFLDLSWYLPKRNTYQVVPCPSLGLRLTFSDNFAIIADIEPGSVVSEIEDIEVGDVLEEINGRLITAQNKGQLKSIMKAVAGQPIGIAIIKAYFEMTGKPYPPMIRLLRDSNLDLNTMHLRRKSSTEASTSMKSDSLLSIKRDDGTAHDDKPNEPAAEQERVPANVDIPGFRVTFIGSKSIGKFGSSDLISPAIDAVVASTKDSPKPFDEVVIEVQEIGIKVSDLNSPTVRLRHSYMEITSCSQSEKNPSYFAYIAGEKPCNVATTFTCYVFHSTNQQHVLEILISMGELQLFKRARIQEDSLCCINMACV